MASLDELIIEENGMKKGIDIYNFISEEIRRVDGWIGGVPNLWGDKLCYKELFYACYKCVDNYLGNAKQNKGFTWEKYGTALNFLKNDNFMIMKLKVKNEAALLINTAIDNFYEKNRESVNNPNVAYNFSVIAYNILKGFDSQVLQPQKEDKKEEAFNYFI